MKILIKLLGSFLFFILLQPEIIKAQCHIDDWTALKALYESTDGDNWTNNTGWEELFNNAPPNCNLDNLYGISLDAAGRVVCIDLGGGDDCDWRGNDGNNLIGSIPLEIDLLSNLEYLYLNHNQLSGSLPAELGNLTNLIDLHLDWNQLNGSLPAQLGNLTNLKDLILYENQFSGSIPAQLGNLTSLEYLSLRNNQLSGSLPAELGNLTNLISFSLSDNQLSGGLPAELGNLTNLEILRLYSNQLSGSLPAELGNLTNLEKLWLYDNQLSGSLPAELGNLMNLWNLNLSSNQLSGNLPAELFNLTNLRELYLFQNQFSGGLHAELGNLMHLEILWLYKNQLNGSLPAELGNLTNLESLSLYKNQLSGSLPTSIGNLTNLTLLEVNDNNLSGCYPSNINVFCSQLNSELFDGNPDISDNNNFDATWEDFCATNAGICDDPCPPNCPLGSLSDVYPGDLNHDGIVNNQDIGLSGLYKFEIGAPRTPEDQNTEWYAHPAEDWNRQHLNNEDIKHFDCNGDGAITDDDRQAVEDNMGEMWSTPEPVDPPNASDYQIVLHPVEEINNNFLRINVALENAAGNELVLQGGHFTIDYGMDNQNVNNATMNFLPAPWIGIPDLNLTTFDHNDENSKTIEIGFTRTDGMDATGSGVIGELILQLDNSAARTAQQNDCMLNLSINTIGMHDSQPYNQPVENRLLQINMCESTCENIWNINDDTQFQNEYKSTNLIETNGFLIIGDEQQVEYSSNRVCLQSGFKVKAGASFRAGYGSCN